MKAYLLIFPLTVSLFACGSKPSQADQILSTLDSLDLRDFDQSSLDSLSYGLISSDNAVSKTVQKVSNTITGLRSTISALNEKVKSLENEVKELKNENNALKNIINDSTLHISKPFQFFSGKTKDN